MRDQGKDFQVKIQCSSNEEAKTLLLSKKLHEVSSVNVLIKSIEIVEKAIVIVFEVLSGAALTFYSFIRDRLNYTVAAQCSVSPMKI